MRACHCGSFVPKLGSPHNSTLHVSFSLGEQNPHYAVLSWVYCVSLVDQTISLWAKSLDSLERCTFAFWRADNLFTSKLLGMPSTIPYRLRLIHTTSVHNFAPFLFRQHGNRLDHAHRSRVLCGSMCSRTTQLLHCTVTLKQKRVLFFPWVLGTV